MNALQIVNAYAGKDRPGYDTPPHLTQTISTDNANNRPARNRAKKPFHPRGHRQSGPSFKSAPVFTPTPGNEIIAHTLEENHNAAAEFRATLTNDDTTIQAGEAPEPILPPCSTQVRPYIACKSTPDNSHPRFEVSLPKTGQMSEQASAVLAKAFQREYQRQGRAEHLPRPASGSPSIKMNTSTGQASQRESSVLSSGAVGAAGYKRARSPSARAERLLLHGLDAKRARNEYGKSLGGGQELGVGVIGGQQAGGGGMTVVLRESGCDIPMFPDLSAGGRHGEEGRQYQVSLDPDLPPLAVEHPARVWNSMIHSLDANLQPVIKWDYERMDAPEGEEGDLWIAHLTLVLPPTHPTIAEHPLFRTLPKNRYKREYVSAVEALGGIKQWAGEPKKLKADAQNNTLVRCISEDAMAWVHAPNGLSVVPDEEDEEEPSYRLIGAPPVHTNGHMPPMELQQPQPMLAAPDIYPIAQLQTAVNDNEIVIDDLEVDTPAGAADPSAQPFVPRTPDSTPFNRTDARDLWPLKYEKGLPDQSPFRMFMDVVHRTLGLGGLDLQVPASIETTIDPPTQLYGCRISVGLPSVKMMQYDAEKMYKSIDAARDAACERALDLGVEDFLLWVQGEHLKAMSEGDEKKVFHPVQQTGDGTKGFGMANGSTPSIVETENGPTQLGVDGDSIDWKKRLVAFCHDLDIPPPTYKPVSKSLGTGKGKTYMCAVVVANERFEVPDERSSLTQAIQAAARRVLVDYFGQPAV